MFLFYSSFSFKVCVVFRRFCPKWLQSFIHTLMVPTRTPEPEHQNQNTRPRTPGPEHQYQNTRPRTPGSEHWNQNTRPRTPEPEHQNQNTRRHSRRGSVFCSRTLQHSYQGNRTSDLLITSRCHSRAVSVNSESFLLWIWVVIVFPFYYFDSFSLTLFSLCLSWLLVWKVWPAAGRSPGSSTSGRACCLATGGRRPQAPLGGTPGSVRSGWSEGCRDDRRCTEPDGWSQQRLWSHDRQRATEEEVQPRSRAEGEKH